MKITEMWYVVMVKRLVAALCISAVTSVQGFSLPPCDEVKLCCQFAKWKLEINMCLRYAYCTTFIHQDLM